MPGPFRDYDAFAEAYAERTQSNAYNAHYERPAIRALLGPLAGLRVLDAGCAAGEHALWLFEQGAIVTAIDISEPMLHLARTRLDPGAVVLAADRCCILRERVSIPVPSSLQRTSVSRYRSPMRVSI